MSVIKPKRNNWSLRTHWDWDSILIGSVRARAKFHGQQAYGGFVITKLALESPWGRKILAEEIWQARKHANAMLAAALEKQRMRPAITAQRKRSELRAT